METIIKYFEFYFISSLRYFLFTGLFFGVFYTFFKTKFEASKIQDKKATKKDFYREIFQSLQSNLVLTFFALLVFFTPLRDYTLVYTSAFTYPLIWIPVSLLLCLVVHDSYFYWMHRILHDKRIFRFTHLVHHKSINPSPFTSYSFHFLEAITEGLVIFIIVFLIPIHPITLIAFGLISFIMNIYGHLGYEIMPKSFRNSYLFEIINSSVYHNLHHKKFNGNYSLYFRFWDKLMHTENPDYELEYDRIQEKRFNNNNK